jgi:uncharacterized membrane protein
MKKLFTMLAAVALVGTFQYCSSSKKSVAKQPEVAKLTFAANVLPLIQMKCSPCHIAPDGKKKHYVTYDAVRTDIDNMIRRIQLSPDEKGFMPFKKTEKLPDSLIAVFVKWRADGLLEK